ncbi:MAG TPA: iron-siderophore ABC transporter substrate-binding protein [Symbiobacteriaceae bacterium]|nr:iron-siderophore ABC transporter substrate-binding protein [Symbiobacteriaceae bacterium]
MTTRYSTRLLGAALLTLSLALAGCGGAAKPAATPAAPAPAAPAAPVERIVKHALGETKVKGTPARVVVLDTGELDIALALNVKPVGAVIAGSESDFPAYLKGKVDGITRVGTIAEPNLETIASLKPDLILTNTLRHEKIYDKLSQIAPTVVGVRPNLWKENLKTYADALGKAQEGEKLLADYTKRLGEIKTKMGDNLAKTKVSIIRSMPDHARIYQNASFSGSIIKEAGFGRPAAQDKDAVFEKVTEERIPDMDGDAIFVLYYGKEKGDSLAKFFTNPLWPQLGAVKANKVFNVDDGHWGLGLGPGAANLILDDLFKFVVK